MHRIFAGMAIWAVVFMVGEGVLGVLTKHSIGRSAPGDGPPSPLRVFADA